MPWRSASCSRPPHTNSLISRWLVHSFTEHSDANIRDFVIGSYVTNNPAGIRSFPYSTSNVTNPLTYSALNTRTEVHAIGEVWANILHNVYAALVGIHGFSQTVFTNPS